MKENEKPTYEELELMRDGYCEGCKGSPFSGCWERCEGFQGELKSIREEMEAGNESNI